MIVHLHRMNPQLITGLAEGGYQVVLLDNRDVGESSKIEKKASFVVQLLKYRIGLRVKSPYAPPIWRLMRLRCWMLWGLSGPCYWCLDGRYDRSNSGLRLSAANPVVGVYYVDYLGTACPSLEERNRTVSRSE